MLRDLEKRGRTEIDALNGAVVQLGVQAGIDVPVNKLLATMIKLRERTRLEELRNTGT
jgi:2-dehydropantoate 2-reductase